MALSDQLARAVLRDLVELPVADELDELGKRRQEIAIAAADRYPLGREGIAAYLPAAVDLAEHVLIGDEHVVDVDRVEELLRR